MLIVQEYKNVQYGCYLYSNKKSQNMLGKVQTFVILLSHSLTVINITITHLNKL